MYYFTLLLFPFPFQSIHLSSLSSHPDHHIALSQFTSRKHFHSSFLSLLDYLLFPFPWKPLSISLLFSTSVTIFLFRSLGSGVLIHLLLFILRFFNHSGFEKLFWLWGDKSWRYVTKSYRNILFLLFVQILYFLRECSFIWSFGNYLLPAM